LTIDLEATFDAYHDGLHRYLVRLVGDPDLAADAAQEAFLRLAQRPPRSLDNLKAWLFTVGTNYAFDTLKVARRRGAILQESPDRTPVGEPAVAPDVSLERQERSRVVRNGLDKLREKERVTLLMRAERFLLSGDRGRFGHLVQLGRRRCGASAAQTRGGASAL
jgi:RNA polymerase sigma-70 factor (ECF subfamily)